MSSTLGEKLRQAREERGISISEVAEQTRISPLYIKSIEEDNYKPLPGGIFNKGFLKSYARYVGYDEHEALEEYSQIVTGNEQSAEEEFKSYRPEVLTDDRSSASILPTVVFAGIILALMTGGILFVVNYIKNQPEPVSPPANVNSNANTAILAPSDTTTAPENTNSPQMESLRVEFKTASDPISISSISDGKSSVILVTPDKPAVFEPKQALRLAYSRSLAAPAQLAINGRTIALPQAPGNPKRAAIEVEINRDNIGQIWQNGAASAYIAPTAPAQQTARPVPKPAAPANAAPKTANAATRPIVTTPR
ncbi:MAG: helix-turn-helix domain-containing protein [Acidobacteriota bacterium]